MTHTPDQNQTGPDRTGGPQLLPRLGAHVSMAGGPRQALRRARHLGVEALQVFPTNPRQWRSRDYPVEDLEWLAGRLRLLSLLLFVHTTYLINLASPDRDLRVRSAAALADAMRFGHLTGAHALVTHIGSHRGDGFKRALPRVAETVARARQLHGMPTPTLLLETSAGSGSTIGASPDELGALVSELGPDVGVCLDTAHLFAAGFAVHEPAGLNEYAGALNANGLGSRVGLIHFNDSATDFGSRHDRHENLWEGRIGRAGLMTVLAHPDFRSVPFVLEVPGFDGRGPDTRNMRRARLMRRAATRAASSRLAQPPHSAAEA